jgi:gas vesicle protein
MKKSVKIVMGVAVAATAGALIGVLLAPERGKDLRRQIREEAKDWLDDFRYLASIGREWMADLKKDATTIEVKEVQRTPGEDDDSTGNEA